MPPSRRRAALAREGNERVCAPRSRDRFLSPSQAVVTVPAYFNDSQRQAHAAGQSDDREGAEVSWARTCKSHAGRFMDVEVTIDKSDISISATS